jgi:phosphoribosylanthranilate isomerase
MRDAENIREVEALGIDLMGFIFWPKSSRYVSECPTYLPTKCKRVGVFVDEDIETVRHIANTNALDFIQLHGKESPEYIQRLGEWKVIKAFNIATADDLSQTKPYEGLVDYFLFDTKGKSVGGNGEKFDWSVLSAYDGSTPFLLSGGISPDDAERVNAFSHPKCIGIDLNSRFEIAPGLKDANALKDYIKKLNTKSQRHKGLRTE